MRGTIVLKIISSFFPMIVLCKEKATPMTNISKGDMVAQYVQKYWKIAVEEDELYGIPASITLAQGIIESNCGRSSLARKHNNHFGVKWRKGRKESYAVFRDDTPKDRFVVYKSAWFSFRDHSKVLKADRYKSLFKDRNYKSWAHGLKRCGYATHPNYGYIVIKIIERYNLTRFDKYKKFKFINKKNWSIFKKLKL